MQRAILLTTAFLTTPVVAQETYWIANRASANIMEVADCGKVLRHVDMGGSIRSAHLAPDGKIWVIRFIQPQFNIVDPTTTPPTVQSINYSLGNPFKIAFDRNGHGWVAGGTGVEEFDANGNSIQTVPLANTAPLGITIDTAGNKWISHRGGPPSVLSRIDGTTGTVTTHPLPAASASLGGNIVADFRGLNAPSHIWVTGDRSGDVMEFDDQGNHIATFTMPTANLGAPVADLNGHIWTGDFRSGDLNELDPATGTVLTTVWAPSINGLSLDSFGRLWATSRITFSPPGPPCEVRRIDPANPAVLEHPGVLLTPTGVAGYGTQSALSTPVHYSLVVNQFGDTDNDGVPNAIEVMNGTSAIDPASNGIISVVSHGPTRVGSAMNFEVFAGTGATTFWALAASEALVPAGMGITLPGFVGEMLLDPTVALPGVVSGSGSVNLPVTIPNDPALDGYTLQFQGFASLPPNMPIFTNITCVNIWM